MAVERFVDTNVLLTATAPAHLGHAAALAVLESGFAERTLYLSGQVIREYLAVATRPQALNGLGLGMGQALGNARQFLARSNFLVENESTREQLFRLLDSVPCAGKQVHDANIAATMLGHGVRVLVTLNGRDFDCFAPAIRVVGLSG
jgi:predicted nucleic acid-binding protein